MKTVSESYIEGIKEGRAMFKVQGMRDAQEHIEALNILCKMFDASNPVGQSYRGERDFWRNKIKNA